MLLRFHFQKTKLKMEKNNTITEIFDGIAIITINRPSKLNALNRETIDELHYTLKEISLKASEL